MQLLYEVDNKANINKSVVFTRLSANALGGTLIKRLLQLLSVIGIALLIVDITFSRSRLADRDVYSVYDDVGCSFISWIDGT